MNNDRAKSNKDNIVALADNPEYQPADELSDGRLRDSDVTMAALECLFANPRFNSPANDEVVAACGDLRPAPALRAARQARLIRMWAEEVVELSRSSA